MVPVGTTWRNIFWKIIKVLTYTVLPGHAQVFVVFKENDIYGRIHIVECDMNDLSSLMRALEVTAPDLIFNMASNANVKASFETPLSILQNNIFSTANLLEAIRLLKIKSLVVHCSTSEVYGKVRPEDVPIMESAPIRPASPYIKKNSGYAR